jgi:hypothetical protein
MGETLSGHDAIRATDPRLRTHFVPGRPIKFKMHYAALPLFLRLGVLLDGVIALRTYDTYSYAYRKPRTDEFGAKYSDHAGWAIDVWTSRQGRVGFPGTLTKRQAEMISQRLKQFITDDGRYVFGWGVSDKIPGVDYPDTYHRINDPMHFFINPGIRVKDLKLVRASLNIALDGTVKTK